MGKLPLPRLEHEPGEAFAEGQAPAFNEMGLAALAAADLDVQVADVAAEPALGRLVGWVAAFFVEFVAAAPAVVGKVSEQPLEALAEDLVEDEFRVRDVAYQFGDALQHPLVEKGFRREDVALSLQALCQELAEARCRGLVLRFLLSHEARLLVNGLRADLAHSFFLSIS